jgi:thimet oligopeptidase
MRIRTILLAGVFGSAALVTSAQAGIPSDVDHFLAKNVLTARTAKVIQQRCDATLTLAGKSRKAIEGYKGPASIGKDFADYDSLDNLLGASAGEMYSISATSPSQEVRDAANDCVSRLSKIATQISLSRPIYDRLTAIPAAGLAPEIAYPLSQALLSYRLSGVDKDLETRNKVEALQQEITDTGISFDRNIAEKTGEITLTSSDELEGLPADYIAAHKPAADGLIHITTNYPDVLPLLKFARKSEVRKAMYIAFQNRAWPDNEEVLKKLLAKRYELAQLLGYANFAELVTADKMIGNAGHVAQFLDDVNGAAAAAAARDQAMLLAREQQIDPAATSLHPWDSSYISNLIQKEKYDFDASVVRQYFTYEKTRAGIFQLVHDLFGADIRPWKTEVWDPSVTAWELYDHGKLIGQFYLDMFPRKGKFTHAEQSGVRSGLKGRQLPVAMLICNFPAQGPMEHGDITTFLHEFGHLIHSLYSGHQAFARQGMNNAQWDFIEAPSQMLEEWTWDYDTLKRFAANDKGEPIPESLVVKMNAGRHFGEAGSWKRQIAYAAVSLGYHTRPAGSFDLTDVYKTEYNRYSLTPYLEGTHPYANFGHLNGYSAVYYTYVWSKAIALDLFTRFKTAGMFDPKTALDYRQMILEPGATTDAGSLIKNFLGRPMSVDAFKEDLQSH